MLYDTLTVREHLWFFGRLKGLTRQEVGGEIEKMLESIKLTEKSNAQSRYLSGGMKRKLSLGLALIGKAKVSFAIRANFYFSLAVCRREGRKRRTNEQLA